MKNKNVALPAFLALAMATLASGPALAHHLMGGRIPASFSDGFLSGIGHPIIGLDHFVSIVAVGCLAATHGATVVLVLAFILAMIGGVTLHMQGAAVPGLDVLVALTVIALGGLMLHGRKVSTTDALVLFAAVGLIHGYALGESIYGAERTPFYAYLSGLALIQSAIALSVAYIARILIQKPTAASPLRFTGAGIAGIGFTMLMQQMLPTV